MLELRREEEKEVKGMEKFFNTAGPVRAENNYIIDPLKRINKDEIMTLIDNWRYFILHAPRQTGKTSSLFALQDYINKEGRYKCLYVNVERMLSRHRRHAVMFPEG